jgi:hypothetical protein
VVNVAHRQLEDYTKKQHRNLKKIPLEIGTNVLYEEEEEGKGIQARQNEIADHRSCRAKPHQVLAERL